MRVGIIGFGSIGQRHYNNLMQYTKDIVILSKRKDIKDAMAVDNWRDFSSNKPFDIFFITNEPYKHVLTAKKCIKLNPRALFIEKPLSHQIKGLQSLAVALKLKNISAWVGYNFHFFHPLMEIKKLLQAEIVGKIYYLHISVGHDLRQWRPRDYRLNYAAKKNQGGGVTLDLIHEINYASWMLEEKLIPKAALIKKVSDLKINTEDCADSLFITKSGVPVSIHQDYLRMPMRRGLEIVGSKGSLRWNTDANNIIIQHKNKQAVKKIKADRNQMFKDELKYFFSLLEKHQFFTNIDEAIYDIYIIEKLKKYAKK